MNHSKSTPASPSTATIRREGNRLLQESSLYLRQHAHNPMNWFPWGPEALGIARAQDKPIFLSIGYSSCHWCHVMEHEVFEKDDVASFMNDHFVCIKVDREERPDLDTVYMQAVQMMTGGGGWPMSVFLTPDLKPFFGGTYFPHEQFRDLTQRVVEVFRTRRDNVEQQAAALTGAITTGMDGARPGAIETELLERAVREADMLYDRTWGGFRARMKFPTPVRWSFLLHRFRKTGDERLEEMVRGTLDAMASGGIRDHIGGGFHRYTVDATWLVPHFEKMLYDNAQLASLYLEAAVVFDEPRYRAVARETLDFLLREMTDDAGGLYASFDADSGGEEGTFYVWSPEELEAVAGPADGGVLASLLGVTAAGNFEGKSVLSRRDPPERVAAHHGLELRALETLFDKWRPRLLETRARRTPPGLDKKVVTAWNGLAISALARGAVVLGDESYANAAAKAADFLWATHRGADGGLLRVSNDGVASNEAILDDYGALAAGLLELHHTTGKVEWALRAKTLVDRVRERFPRAEGGFYLTPEGHEAPLGRKFDPLDNVEPSGNATCLWAMHQLALLTGDVAYRTEVEHALQSMATVMGKAGLEMAAWLDVAQLLLGPTVEVVVAGSPDDERTREMVDRVRALQAPHVVLLEVPSDGPDAESLNWAAPTAGKVARDGVPSAYVCKFGSCNAPTADAEAMCRQVMEGWAR